MSNYVATDVYALFKKSIKKNLLHNVQNDFRKGEEHLDYLEASDEDKCVLWLHCVHHHESRQGVQYSMRVTGSWNESKFKISKGQSS